MNHDSKEDIFKAVSGWMLRNNMEIIITDYLWGDDYCEMFLTENDFGIFELKKFNIEIVRYCVYQVPVYSVDDFKQLIRILEPDL